MNVSRRRQHPGNGLRGRLYEIIFEADSPAGKGFDVLLLVAILASVVTVMLESVASVRAEHAVLLNGLEWAFTVLFSIEYLVRLYCVRSPARYAASFYGVVDLLSTAPTWLSLLLPGAQTLLLIRTLRLLRVFRVFKMGRYLGEAHYLMVALKASREKITVFLVGVLAMVTLVGALMYLVEGPEHGFTSIPRAMYWAIVTMTTVGYGDVAPQTVLGQFLASFLMVLGYGIIAVPTGIVTVEMAYAARRESGEDCRACGDRGHDHRARFCKACGANLDQPEATNDGEEE